MLGPRTATTTESRYYIHTCMMACHQCTPLTENQCTTLTENCMQQAAGARARTRLKHGLDLCQRAKTTRSDLPTRRGGGRLTDFQLVNRVTFRVTFRALQAGGTAIRWSLCCARALTHLWTNASCCCCCGSILPSWEGRDRLV